MLDVRVTHIRWNLRRLRYALYGFLASFAVVLLLTLPPGAPLRNTETGEIFGDSPFMSGILVIISLLFLVAGYAYGKGAKTISISAPNGTRGCPFFDCMVRIALSSRARVESIRSRATFT